MTTVTLWLILHAWINTLRELDTYMFSSEHIDNTAQGQPQSRTMGPPSFEQKKNISPLILFIYPFLGSSEELCDFSIESSMLSLNRDTRLPQPESLPPCVH